MRACRAVLLEARERIGGRAWTYRAGDLALDLGCGWLHSADTNEWAALAEKLGFEINDHPPPWARPAWEGNFSRGRAEGLLGRVAALLCVH